MKTKPTHPFFVVRKGGLPEATSNRYRFHELQIGQYFDVPRALDHSVRVQASRYGKRHGRTYKVCRIDGERVRVYRMV